MGGGRLTSSVIYEALQQKDAVMAEALVVAQRTLGLLAANLVNTLDAEMIVFGGGVWATHFVAMLAFQPGLAIGYDIGLTLISIGAAMSISWLGFAAALRLGAVTSGGAMLGVAGGAVGSACFFIGLPAHAARMPDAPTAIAVNACRRLMLTWTKVT